MCPDSPASAGCGGPRDQSRGRLSITVAELGEFGLIAAIAALLPAGRAQVIGIGRRRGGAPRAGRPGGGDARTCWWRGGISAATGPGLRHRRQGGRAEPRRHGGHGRHARPPCWSGFATPGDLPVAWAQDLVRGMAAECARAGATVAAATSAAPTRSCSRITALGDLAGREPVTRSGARGRATCWPSPGGWAARRPGWPCSRRPGGRVPPGSGLLDGAPAAAPAV